MPELTSISTIEALLQKYGVRPQKRFGQNFLVSNQALQKIVAAADIGPNDVILEIGPGIGSLTFELARRAKRVIAIEKDRTMVQILRDLLKQKNISNVEIIQKDARDITEKEFGIWDLGFGVSSYKIVANLPYYIATPTIRKFLEAGTQPEQMVFTIQKEVARRICAKPPHMNVLALSVQFYADPEIIATIPNSAFWPKPEVDGAIIKITPHKDRPEAEFSKQFFKIIKAGFRQPRKKLISNIKKEYAQATLESVLTKLSIALNTRAQALSLDQWRIIALTVSYQGNGKQKL